MVFAAFGLTPRQKVDLGGRRRDAFGEEFAAEERVDQRRLAGVELADDDEQKELVELTKRLGQGPAFVGGDIVAVEGRGNLGEEVPLLADDLLVLRGEDGVEHETECSAPAARTLRIMNFE